MNAPLYSAAIALSLPIFTGSPVLSQDIHCTDRACSGTDIMGNNVLLRVDSNRTDATQRYTARIGEAEIQVERRRSPLVSGGWNGPALMQRPITEVTGHINSYPVKLHIDSAGLATGTAFGEPVTCAVDGFSIFNPSPCF